MQANLATTLRRMLTPWRLTMAPCKLITVLWRLIMVKRRLIMPLWSHYGGNYHRFGISDTAMAKS
jgi:hypothetical protein